MAAKDGGEDGSTERELALAYSYIDVCDDDSDGARDLFYAPFSMLTLEADVIARLGVWQLEGAVAYGQLLKFAIDKENFNKTVVVIAVDLSKPWDIMASLDKWIELLESNLQGLNVPRETLIDAQDRRTLLICVVCLLSECFTVRVAFMGYTEDGRPLAAGADLASLPLPEGALTHNLGLPIIVVGLKVRLWYIIYFSVR